MCVWWGWQGARWLLLLVVMVVAVCVVVVVVVTFCVVVVRVDLGVEAQGGNDLFKGDASVVADE